MVEKITITPQEVRGLGDIISPKTLSDFNKQNSTLTQTTDTVHGTTTKIFQQQSTIIYSDINNSTNASTGYNTGRGTLSTDGNDKVFTRNQTGSSYFIFTTASGYANRLFVDVPTSLEITMKSANSFRFNIEENGGSTTSTNYFNTTGKYVLTVTSTGYTITKDGETVQENTNTTFNKVSFRVQLDSTTDSLKFNYVLINALQG